MGIWYACPRCYTYHKKVSVQALSEVIASLQYRNCPEDEKKAKVSV